MPVRHLGSVFILSLTFTVLFHRPCDRSCPHDSPSSLTESVTAEAEAMTPRETLASSKQTRVVDSLISPPTFIGGLPNLPGAGMRLSNLAAVVDPADPNLEWFYFSFTTSTNVPGVGVVEDEDIVRFSPACNVWQLYFDGSLVGITADVGAFCIEPNGNILMSFKTATNVPLLIFGGPDGTFVDDSDIVRFNFLTSGTAPGYFTFEFDGSDVGLTTSSEDIDGLHRFADGSLAITVVGGVSVPGLSRSDEDVLVFTPTQLGVNTSGTWSVHFDGSDIALNGNTEDLDGITFLDGELYFSTTGTYLSSGGHSADDESISRFEGNLGIVTNGTLLHELDLSDHGISSVEDIDGMSIVIETTTLGNPVSTGF